MMLETIKIDRKNKQVYLSGNILIYVTPDIGFLPNIEGSGVNLSPYGGRLCCQGDINIRWIPYVDFSFNNTDKSIYEQIDEILSTHIMSNEAFKNNVEDADDCCDNFAWMKPIDEIIKEHDEKGWDFDYKQIFSNL